MRNWLAVNLICFGLINSVYTQTPNTTKTSFNLQAPEIKATVKVDRKEVPQNREVICTITVTWKGDLNRYEILQVESPVLTNLEELGNSSSNSVAEVDGVQQAIRTFEYILQPVELGMAYIDGTVVEYSDAETNETYRLITDRLELRVIDPIIERSLKPFILAGLLLVLIVVVSTAGFIFVKRNKERKAELERQAQELIPIEERYLSELTEIDLKNPNVVHTFSLLSKILRRYVSEKYQISALEITSKEITAELNKLAVSENIINHVDEALNSCDIAKFSGGQVEEGTLERIFTLVEDVLTKNKSEKIAELQNDSNGK